MGIINQFNVTDRITIVGKITTYPFTLPDKTPFSIFVVAKESATVLCEGKLYQTTDSVEFPIVTNL